MNEKFVFTVLISLAFFFSSADSYSYLNYKNLAKFNNQVDGLIRKIKRLIDLKDAKETVPIENEKILELINKLKFPENDTLCLSTEKCAEEWMKDYNYLLSKVLERGSYLEFTFYTNITDENEKKVNEFSTVSNSLPLVAKSIANEFLKNCDNWDPSLRRMLYLASLDMIYQPNDISLLSSIQSKLEAIYAQAVICENDAEPPKCLSLDPDILSLFQSSRDFDQLKWAWEAWHNATGAKMRNLFTKAVLLRNKAARENNYKDLSELWIGDYEDDNFEANMDKLFNDIRPLYEHLHAYVRRKLNSFYSTSYKKMGSKHDPKLIPAHLLGNIWAQTWENTFDLVVPYADEPQMNLTQILIDNKYTPVSMFKQSERFFVSLGLSEMTPAFWKYSMIEKPVNMSVECHGSATDFFNGFDYRIKMCTSVNEENFYVVHHEMGHIEYFMSYSNQPAIFRGGANSAFHEAIGDTIALSVMTPKHLHTLRLIDTDETSYEQDINNLMQMALKKLAFIPFAYLMDKWRFNVFRGIVNETNYTKDWWLMRRMYQGLEPPVERTENDFDPAGKYHIVSNTPYTRYFMSTFLQFQFYKSLCEQSGHVGYLHKCDFYGSLEAGNKLNRMLKLGSSKHWSFALNLLTNTNKVSSDAFVEYFKPLIDWLQKENSKYPNDPIGF